jgi:two-component system cell cycle response regulator
MEIKTILVVEDNPINMKLVRTLLQVEGYNILEAEDAARGLQLARDCMPDLILMDIQLPGVDGLSATRSIRDDAALKEIPVIALTAHAMQGDDQNAFDAGCDGYLTKPLDTRKFSETIRRHLSTSCENGSGEAQGTAPFRPKILIVDDLKVNVKLLATRLPNSKYEILKAYGGKEAIEVASRELPDLILLDYMMPEVDGYDVTKALRSDPRTEDIPIIIITALDSTEEKIGILEAGAEEFLNKPVNTTELLARVQSLLLLKQYKEQLRIRRQSTDFFMLPQNDKEREKIQETYPAILIVEDGERDTKLMQSYLADHPVQVYSVRSGREALSMVREKRIDLVLLDIMLPDIDGFEVCRRLKGNESTQDIQVVAITCLQDLENKIKGIELGVDDYLIKPVHSRELMARLRTLIRKKTYLEQLHNNFENALNTAVTDGLTNLHNQSYFKRYLHLELKRADRYGYPVTLIMVDLDDFKACNDTFGHVCGDKILKELARVVQRAIRETDLAARYGGEEFAVALPYCNKDDGMIIAERIRSSIAQHPFRSIIEGFEKSVTVSAGIATFPFDAPTPEALLEVADRLLYQAKREGKNRVCQYERTDSLP